MAEGGRNEKDRNDRLGGKDSDVFFTHRRGGGDGGVREHE